MILFYFKYNLNGDRLYYEMIDGKYRRVSRQRVYIEIGKIHPDKRVDDYIYEHLRFIDISKMCELRFSKRNDEILKKKKRLQQKLNEVENELSRRNDEFVECVSSEQKLQTALAQAHIEKYNDTSHPEVVPETAEVSGKFHEEYPEAYVKVEKVERGNRNASKCSNDKPPSANQSRSQTYQNSQKQQSSNQWFTNDNFFSSGSSWGGSGFDNNTFFGDVPMAKKALTEKQKALKLLKSHGIVCKKTWREWSRKNHPDKNPENNVLFSDLSASVTLLRVRDPDNWK